MTIASPSPRPSLHEGEDDPRPSLHEGEVSLDDDDVSVVSLDEGDVLEDFVGPGVYDDHAGVDEEDDEDDGMASLGEEFASLGESLVPAGDAMTESVEDADAKLETSLSFIAETLEDTLRQKSAETSGGELAGSLQQDADREEEEAPDDSKRVSRSIPGEDAASSPEKVVDGVGRSSVEVPSASGLPSDEESVENELRFRPGSTPAVDPSGSTRAAGPPQSTSSLFSSGSSRSSSTLASAASTASHDFPPRSAADVRSAAADVLDRASRKRRELLAKLLQRLPLEELQQFRASMAQAESPREKIQLLRVQIAASYVRYFGLFGGSPDLPARRRGGPCGKRQARSLSSTGEEARKKRIRKRDMIKRLLMKYGDVELVRHIVEKHQEPKFIKWWDKVSFTAGILNVILMCWMIFGSYKFLLPYLYTLQFSVLIPWRFFKYRREKYEYFLLDFCYFGNIALLLYLWLFPDNPELFVTVFAVSAGPMLTASALFRNSLVFHSWEHCTSVFIHLVPFLCCYLIRHHHDSFQHFGIQPPESLTLYHSLVLPIVFYVAQQIFAYIAVYYIWPIPDDPEYLNLFRYVVSTNWGRGILARVPGGLNPKYTEGWYTFLNFCVSVLTLVPAWLWYQSRWAMVLFGLVMVTVNIWNGASFYVEVFSRKYQDNLKQKEELRVLKEEKRARERAEMLETFELAAEAVHRGGSASSSAGG